MNYDFRRAEAAWRDRWKARVPHADPTRTKFYNLVEFPYPSAEGLHVGHVYTYCGADAFGRYQSMNGKDVFQPMGWDSFGIHTENYALKIGQTPRSVTDRATANYKRQLERIGANWSWDAELRTDDPRYYRWTQWIFLKLYEAGLAKRKESAVIWCPSCMTVLAFEQVEGSRCERCNTTVTTKTMKQWYLRITAYADELLDSLDELDWPDLSKQLQREWIGRSDGAEVCFKFDDESGRSLVAFTTRADTLAGVTFVAVAPEHPVVEFLADRARNSDEIRDYATEVKQRVGTDRLTTIGQGKQAVVTGARVINPLTGDAVPVIVADYVVADYGDGVVMGVPGHDARDARVAKSLNLAIRTVLKPQPDTVDCANTNFDEPFTGDGILVNSGQFDGMPSGVARGVVAEWLRSHDAGKASTEYRLRDWLVSRQRYWGSPIPIIHCDICGEVPVPVSDLPVELPDIPPYRTSENGQSPLALIDTFVKVGCPQCGEPARRETDVLDTFVESSWYFLRYPSHDRDDVPWDPDLTSVMLPVDMYAGGREHATRHHLYARFMTRALHDLGLIGFQEPFAKLRLHGLIIKDGAKMSKSRGNVINPDEYIEQVGADVLRSYLLFCGPWEQGGDFNDSALHGLSRFNDRVWELIHRASPSGSGIDMSQLQRAVQKVSTSIENLKFNVAIAELMSLTNWMKQHYTTFSGAQWREAGQTLALLLAPLEPFFAEEIWSTLGGQESVHDQQWPVYDPAVLELDTVAIPIQINGRVQHKIDLPTSADHSVASATALSDPVVVEALHGREVRRFVYVPGRIINLVV